MNKSQNLDLSQQQPLADMKNASETTPLRRTSRIIKFSEPYIKSMEKLKQHNSKAINKENVNRARTSVEKDSKRYNIRKSLDIRDAEITNTVDDSIDSHDSSIRRSKSKTRMDQ